jgi:UDP-N-acetylglucosamine 2-epimerase (non-hydrolysing)
MKLLVPFGTRPEIIKLAPVLRALRQAGDPVTVVATGQHADPSMTEVFYAELGVRPDITFAVAGTPAERLAAMLRNAAQVVADHQPEAVLVLGDTQTVPTFCLAARNCGVPVVHLEAGLRSFNDTSVEEVNRRVAAATASLHLAPTAQARRFLLSEGVPDERIAVVGNPVLDVLRTHGAQPRPIDQRRGVVVTAHRATNVDNPERREQLVQLVRDLAASIGPVTFPLHPRTRRALDRDGGLERLRDPRIALTDPLPYASMIRHLAEAKVVVTDSGGLQEEAAWLGVPVVVLRRSTPRWESVHAGTAVLTGMDAPRALKAAVELTANDAQQRIAAAPCPYGDGHTAERVVDILHAGHTGQLLRLAEPDFVDREPPV